MNKRFENTFEGKKGIIILSLILWLSIIFLIGTHLRSRESDVETGVGLDWLVMLQVSVALFSICFALFLIRTSKNTLGFGSKALMAYTAAAGFSAIFSNYSFTILGYWILLLGLSLLIISLVQRAQSNGALYLIENIWLFIVTLMLIKDLVAFFLYGNTIIDGQMSRLGMGVTHANAMSFQAVLAFMISLSIGDQKHHKYLWLLRWVYIFIILASRTRMALMAFILGCIIYGFFKVRKIQFLGMILLCIVGSLLLIFMLGISLNIPYFVKIFFAINRDQDMEELMSITGRTDIWQLVIHKIRNRPIENQFFGSGYGVTRFVINEDVSTSLFFYVYHCHNAFLEHMLGMGIFGVLTYLILIFYNIKWYIDSNKLRNIFSEEFRCHALIIVTIFFLMSFTEVPIGMKINPCVALYFFYTISLDKVHLFLSKYEQNNHNM